MKLVFLLGTKRNNPINTVEIKLNDLFNRTGRFGTRVLIYLAFKRQIIPLSTISQAILKEFGGKLL